MTDAQAAMTPEQRLAQNLCCECAADLTVNDPAHHSQQHWPLFIRPDGTNAEAIRRQGLMNDYIGAHPPTRAASSTEKPAATSTSPPHTRS